MSKRYTAGVVSSTSPTVNAAGASGVFTLNQQSAAQSTNNWPPYKVEKSLRFRASATGYLSRTFVSSNPKAWTFSAWVKRAKLGSAQSFFISTLGGAGVPQASSYFTSGDAIQIYDYTGSAYTFDVTTSQLFRDTSAWYHFVFVYDSANATSSNRVRLYVNGSQITAFSSASYPTQNADCAAFNRAYTHYISQQNAQYFDGYMAEVNFIDGQALTPSSFGGTDKDGNWSPIAYTGSYGTNGFYLNFKDVTSAATTGYDYSGNGNNWTLSGFNVSTANTSYDSVIDVPEDQSDGTANNRGNYATFNPLDYNSTYLTLSAANLQQAYAGVTAAAASRATMTLPTTGKWYWEVTLTTIGTNNTTIRAGICSPTTAISGNSIDNGSTSYLQITSGQKRNNATDSTYGAGFSNGQILQVLYDATAGAIYFGQNNSFANGTGSFNQTFSGATAAFTGLSGELAPCFITYGGSDIAVNFGQRPFAYAPPSGFKTLNTFNLPEPTIKQPNKYFDAVIWTGDQTNKQIPLNFTADFVWAKRRNNSDNHVLYDAIRGVNNGLNSNTTDAEATNNYGLDFDNGNYLAIDGTQYFGGGGGSGITFVAWNWNAGGSTVTNTAGSISAQVRANPTAGFSVVTYTGNGVSGATVGHGLGVTPSMVIIKSRSNNTNWQVKHPALNANQNLVLNSTAATDTAPGSGYISAISSSTLTLLNGGSAIINVNDNGSTYVAYCFAQVAGYSAFGSYTGNGSADGPFVFTGFRPRYLMIKRTDTTNNWVIQDTSRDTYNVSEKDLYADTSGAEATYAAEKTDILSNGFKQRQTGVSMNASGGTYIYAAFAETPFKYARAR